MMAPDTYAAVGELALGFADGREDEVRASLEAASASEIAMTISFSTREEWGDDFLDKVKHDLRSFLGWWPQESTTPLYIDVDDLWKLMWLEDDSSLLHMLALFVTQARPVVVLRVNLVMSDEMHVLVRRYRNGDIVYTGRCAAAMRSITMMENSIERVRAARG